MSIGITTFNRPDYCVDLLCSLSTEDEVLARVDKLFVSTREPSSSRSSRVRRASRACSDDQLVIDPPAKPRRFGRVLTIDVRDDVQRRAAATSCCSMTMCSSSQKESCEH